jgi:hypothetical protein
MDILSFGSPVGAIMQVAHVVEDMEREMERWASELGVGPFFYIRHFPVVNSMYRGQPASLDIDVALAFSGSMCIELVRQNDRAPSVYREVVDARGYGFHHWGVSAREFDTELARRATAGVEVVASGSVSMGSRAAYLKTGSAIGGLLEIIEITPPVEEFFGMVHAAARSWDGKDPIRVLG